MPNPKKNLFSNTNCRICLRSFNDESFRIKRKRVTTKCGHTFCKECFDEYIEFKQDTKCPNCRQELSMEIKGNKKCHKTPKLSSSIPIFFSLCFVFLTLIILLLFILTPLPFEKVE